MKLYGLTREGFFLIFFLLPKILMEIYRFSFKIFKTLILFFKRSISILNLSKIKGFILNIPSDYKIGGFIPLPWERKHW